MCTHKEFRSVHTEGHKKLGVHTRDAGYTQPHDRNKSATQTHEEPRRVHTRKRASVCGLSTRELLGNRWDRALASGVPKPSVTMSSIRHVLLWATHHNVINLSLIKKRSLDNPSRLHQPVAEILMLGTEVWTIRHDVNNPSRGS